VWAALAPLRVHYPDARWLPADKLHLTLVFLGATDRARVGSIEAALAAVAGSHNAIDVATGQAGGRPSDHRGGVAWLRIARGAAPLSELALALDAALGSATYDERRQPRPHLTVARRVDAATIHALGEWAAAREPFTWRVDRIVLMRSHMGPGGSRYEELSGHWLTGGAQPA
jgi:RNA 2',3'-cyclic 3'-phosphodiesterase